MATRKEEQVQRGHYYAIVDEVDSILIDEARTPLIISGPAVASSNIQIYQQYRPQVADLVRAQTMLCNRLVSEAQQILEKAKNATPGNENDAPGTLTVTGGPLITRNSSFSRSTRASIIAPW